MDVNLDSRISADFRLPLTSGFVGYFGGCDRDRTCDPLIKSQSLHQTVGRLHYAERMQSGQSAHGPKRPKPSVSKRICSSWRGMSAMLSAASS